MTDETANDPKPTLVVRNIVLKSIVAFGLAMMVALPALLVDIPAMMDYPNLLARLYLRVTSGGSSHNPFYQIYWALYPNLAMDILVPPLARLAGVELTAKMFYIFSNILVVTGSMAIEYCVKGKVYVSVFTSMVLLYCMPFTWGFLNFQFGLGLALWGIAAWLWFGDRQWLLRAVIHLLIVFALSLAHFIALGIYGASIGLLELSRFFESRLALKIIFITFLTIAAPGMIALGLMASVGGPSDWGLTGWDAGSKLFSFWGLISGYSFSLSFTSIILIWLIIIFEKRHLSITRAGMWVLLGLAGLFLVFPTWLFGVAFVDVRVLAGAGFIVPAFISVTDRQAARRFAFFLCAIAFINVVYVSYVWRSYRESYSSMKSSFELLERRSLILVSIAKDAESLDLSEAPIYHMPTLAVHYADALVSSLFLVPGVELRPKFRYLDPRETLHGVPPPVPIKLLEAIVTNPSANAPRFIRNWYREFDYLYLLGSRLANPMSDLLQEIVVHERFTLYRIKKRSERSDGNGPN